MKVTVVSLEFSLDDPAADVGDPTSSPLFNRSVPQVPVLHIFGYTAAMQSACVHIHNVFPYFFVPRYIETMSAIEFGAQLEAVAVRALQLHGSARIVHHVEVVQGVPFYGFSTTPRPFFKVFIFRAIF